MKRLEEYEFGYEYYRAARYEMKAGEFLDVGYMDANNDPLSNVNKQVVGELGYSNTSAFYVFGGIGMAVGPEFSFPCQEGYDFRYNLKGLGMKRFEAVTDLKFYCVSPHPRLDGDYSMYKIKTVSTTEPLTVSNVDGITLCVISGEATDSAGNSYKGGFRIKLTSDPITLTPINTLSGGTGGNPFQYFIVYTS